MTPSGRLRPTLFLVLGSLMSHFRLCFVFFLLVFPPKIQNLDYSSIFQMPLQIKTTPRLFISLSTAAAGVKSCPNRRRSDVLPVLWSPGLLNFNGPCRGRALLGSGQERQDHNDDDEEDNKRAEEEAAVVHCSACIEEHFIERLSPTLHRGNA